MAARNRQQDAGASAKCTSCRRSARRWSSCPRRSSRAMALPAELLAGGARSAAHHEPRGEAPPDAVHRPADARRRRGADPRAHGRARGPARRRPRARHRRLERWRERLIADDAALTEFAARASRRRPAGAAHADPQRAQGSERGQAAARLSRAVPGAQETIEARSLCSGRRSRSPRRGARRYAARPPPHHRHHRRRASAASASRAACCPAAPTGR